MEEKPLKILSKRGIICIYSVLALLMLIGTFADYPLDQALNAPGSLFAVFISHYGLYPAVLCTMATAAVFIKLIRVNPRDLISWLCLVFNIYMLDKSIREFIKLFRNDTETFRAANLAVGLLLAGLLAVYVYIKTDTTNPAYVRSAASVILFAFSTQFILINKVIKTPWGRPRYRALLKLSGEVEFRPWYLAGLTETARGLIAGGQAAADDFKSFPSGHAGCAACLVFLTYLSRIIPDLRRQETTLTICGLAWIALTILGRMIAGAHFLTDVTFATLIAWTAFVVLSKVLMRVDKQY